MQAQASADPLHSLTSLVEFKAVTRHCLIRCCLGLRLVRLTSGSLQSLLLQSTFTLAICLPAACAPLPNDFAMNSLGLQRTRPPSALALSSLRALALLRSQSQLQVLGLCQGGDSSVYALTLPIRQPINNCNRTVAKLWFDDSSVTEANKSLDDVLASVVTKCVLRLRKARHVFFTNSTRNMIADGSYTTQAY